MGGHASLTGAPSTLVCSEESGIAAGAAGFPWAGGDSGLPAMNRFNGLCKVCSERRYRQVCIPLYRAGTPRQRVPASLGEISGCLGLLLPWLGSVGAAVRHRLGIVTVCEL